MKTLKTVRNIACSIAFFFGTWAADAQQFSAGINTETPNPNAVLHLVSPNGDQGLLIPSLTNAQRGAMGLTATDKGMMVFDSDDNAFYFWDGAAWVSLNVPANIADGTDWSELTGIPANLDLDATDDVTLTTIPAGTSDISGDFQSGLVVNSVGGRASTEIASATNIVLGAPSLDTDAADDVTLATFPNLDTDATDDLSLTTSPATGDISGNFSTGFTVNQVGGQAALDIASATTIVLSAPALDTDASDDVTLTAFPNLDTDATDDFDLAIHATPTPPNTGDVLSWTGTNWDAATPPVAGDMFAATYDPNNILDDAFDLSNHITPTAPATGDVLSWTGTIWDAAPPTPGVNSGNGITIDGSNNVNLGGTLSAPTTITTGSAGEDLFIDGPGSLNVNATTFFSSTPSFSDGLFAIGATGQAGSFLITNTTSTDIALTAGTYGSSGSGFQVDVSNPSNNSPAVNVQNGGAASAVNIVTLNNANNSPALSISSFGTGPSIVTDKAIGIGTTTPSVSLDIATTDAIRVPVGDNTQRPSPSIGMLRYNTTSNGFEGYIAGAWGPLGGFVSDFTETQNQEIIFGSTVGAANAFGTSDFQLGAVAPLGRAFLSATSFGNPSELRLTTAGGSQGSELSLGVNNPLGEIVFEGYHSGPGYAIGANIRTETTQAWASGNLGTRMIFSTIPTGSGTPVDGLVIDGGNVGIGTPTPAATLDVNGSVNAVADFTLGGNLISAVTGPFNSNPVASDSRIVTIDGGPITEITAGQQGQEIILISQAAGVDIIDVDNGGTNIQLANNDTNYIMNVNATLHLVYIGSFWIEIGRSPQP